MALASLEAKRWRKAALGTGKRREIMKRNTFNFVVDLITALVMLGIAGTGLIVRFVLPAGSGHSKALWGLGRHDWGDVHFWLAVAAGSLMLVHVALHWPWVCLTTLRLTRRGEGDHANPSAMTRNIAGVAIVLAVTAMVSGFVWIANANVRMAAAGGGQHGGGAASQTGEHEGELGRGQTLRGSMTLAEVSAATRIPVPQILNALGLPADTPPDRRLGQLSREQGIPMEKAREAILVVQRRSTGKRP